MYIYMHVYMHMHVNLHTRAHALKKVSSRLQPGWGERNAGLDTKMVPAWVEGGPGLDAKIGPVQSMDCDFDEEEEDRLREQEQLLLLEQVKIAPCCINMCVCIRSSSRCYGAGHGAGHDFHETHTIRIYTYIICACTYNGVCETRAVVDVASSGRKSFQFILMNAYTHFLEW